MALRLSMSSGLGLVGWRTGYKSGLMYYGEQYRGVHFVLVFVFFPPESVSAPRGLPLRPAGYSPAPGGVQAGVDQQQRSPGSPACSRGPVLPELAPHLLVPQIPAGARGRHQRVGPLFCEYLLYAGFQFRQLYFLLWVCSVSWIQQHSACLFKLLLQKHFKRET